MAVTLIKCIFKVFLWIFLLCYVHLPTEAYPGGAPTSSCSSLDPKHSRSQRSGTGGYSVSAVNGETYYQAGQSINCEYAINHCFLCVLTLS